MTTAAMLSDSSPMGWCGIAHILSPLIVRIFQRKLLHEIVAVGFGQNRRSGNAHKQSITLDNTSMRYKGIRGESIAIDEQVLGTISKLVDSPVHS